MAVRVIFCDTEFPPEATERLRVGLAGRRLVRPATTHHSNLVASESDGRLREADVAFGQPDPASVLAAPALGWVQLTSAGYGRYDEPGFRQAARDKGLRLTTSSTVYADPCAEHVLALMLAGARSLPECREDQRRRAFASEERRRSSFLLRGQRVVLLGFGAIGRRLVELLAPFEVEVVAVRRTARGDEPVPLVPLAELDRALGRADHVVDLLPESATTLRFVDARRLAAMAPTARFYNVGRGTTVDQPALLDALERGTLAAAYLDVTDPEPLPPDDPLWSAPHCHLTPHSAGGHTGEHLGLVEHFLANLGRLERGEPLADRVI